MVKFEKLGVGAHILRLIVHCLVNFNLRVVVNGLSSKYHEIGASLPQGSVLGPLHWNAFFNIPLQLSPQSHAYAEYCTLSFSYEPSDRTDD